MDEIHREEILRILREAINAVHSAEMCATLRAPNESDMDYDARLESSNLVISKIVEIVEMMGGGGGMVDNSFSILRAPQQIQFSGTPIGSIFPGIWTPIRNEFVREQMEIFEGVTNDFSQQPLTPYEAWRLQEGLRPWQEEAADLEKAAAVFKRKPAPKKKAKSRRAKHKRNSSNSTSQFRDQASQTVRRPRRNKRGARRKAPVLDKRKEIDW